MSDLLCLWLYVHTCRQLFCPIFKDNTKFILMRIFSIQKNLHMKFRISSNYVQVLAQLLSFYYIIRSKCCLNDIRHHWSACTQYVTYLLITVKKSFFTQNKIHFLWRNHANRQIDTFDRYFSCYTKYLFLCSSILLY